MQIRLTDKNHKLNLKLVGKAFCLEVQCGYCSSIMDEAYVYTDQHTGEIIRELRCSNCNEDTWVLVE